MTARVLAAVASIAKGHPVIVTDDVSREDEGDLVVPADAVDASVVTFMAVHCRGLICLALTGERLDELGLPQMVPGAKVETNFAMSIDFDVPGSTGISAFDRARTIRKAVDRTTTSASFRTPGHIFPLRAVNGGVLARRGHTEASVDLARLAGRYPGAVICEIINDDGTMARGDSLVRFAERHELPMVSIAELSDYVRAVGLYASLPASAAPLEVPTVAATSVQRVVETTLPNRFGRWRMTGYRSEDGLEYVAMVLGRPFTRAEALVRVHSECLTGDALGSMRCDCGAQLEATMSMIQEHGEGAIVYVRGHEGRGIGLLPKLEAYALQDAGLDTIDANLELGYKADERTYAGAAEVLCDLGASRIRLITNNPDKMAALEDAGLTVVARIPLITAPNVDNISYLRTKRTRMGHQLGSPGSRAQESAI